MPRKRTLEKKPAAPGSSVAARLRINNPLWGVHAVEAAWRNPARTVHALYATSQGLEELNKALSRAGSAALSFSSAGVPQAKGGGPRIVCVDRAGLDRTLPRGAVHQGIALDCDPLEDVFLRDLVIAAAHRPRAVFLMLDQVTDPHNVGAILRSACAFGASGVIMQKRHAPDLTGSAGGLLAKTACGAVEHVPVVYETNLTRALETLQEAGFFAIGLDERGEDIATCAVPDRCVLVLGAEGPGLRRLIKEQCDTLARLPMKGPMPSINVSNAAAVALYALAGK
ncbi:MAG: 23S rRNA (guanosine(2251)-2'-O)-methyltransferase RlmB [Alphaproteobacteria bacterium]|nr:23S rRNA (guanosine(2251)-2'-O)-methyltransferase RlmB [Alphaproteobacteria bacterium]